MNKRDRNRPRGLALRLLSRITREHAISFPKAEEIIIKCCKKYSGNWHGTRKHIYGENFSSDWMVKAFEKRNKVQVAIYRGEIVIRVKWDKVWRTLDQFYKYIELEAINAEEWKCKANKTLLRKLNQERLKWQKLQQQVS